MRKPVDRGPVGARADDLKAIVVKHLTVSRDFTLKVADQMPEADYAFKLTPPQMSFAEQMAHLASDQVALLAPFTNQKPTPSKPASMSKKDVMAYVRQTYDAVDCPRVEADAGADRAESYPGFGQPMTGLELLMFVLDHSTITAHRRRCTCG